MYNITLIPGDGIGYEVSESARQAVEATGVAVSWDIQNAGADVFEAEGSVLPQRVLDSIAKNKVALKGPITTPVGKGFRSVNVALRKEFDLYVNMRPVCTIKNIPSRYDNVDLVIFRENTEDLYAGIERMVDDKTAESIKRFTYGGCERILRYGFEYAKENGRKKVTVVHKANIMKLTDGMFLDIANNMSKEYPSLEYEDIIVDATCMKLVQSPEKFDVMILPNLYGDIVSDLCAGLVGGLGVAPGANIGTNAAIFEAIHGSAPDIAGKNIANPTAIVLSAAMMLRYLNEKAAAEKIENAVKGIIEEGKYLTADLGGRLGTKEFTSVLTDRITAK